MVKRSWRNFDYLLLVALLLLAAYGVVMIYSATINTLGVESPVQRQIVFAAVGVAIVLVTASVDYGLLEIVQHPFAVLTPLVLALLSVGMVITRALVQGQGGDGTSSLGLSLPDIAPALVGVVLIVAVYVADRLWIEKLDLILGRLLAVTGLFVAVGVAVFALLRLENMAASAGQPGPVTEYLPYLMVGALAAVYLLDCLMLRITDVLRNAIYTFMLALLAVILMIGQAAGGSQRWLGAGTIQPSELSKILVIIVLAKLLADRKDRMEQYSTVLVSLGVVAVPMVLIYLQPDLGTALALIAIWVAMIWMAKVRFRHLFVLLGGGALLLPLAWFGLEDYMRRRLLLFIDPASDPDSYFNVHQSLVSIGSGGWTGKGLTHGTQSQLHFLRVRHTDFIFAVTAEEVGFLGAVAMIGLLFFVLWRILRVAERSKDTFGQLIASGMAALIFFQAVVNIGMNLGLMPVTGIPLPFVSYGGSSFLTLMVGIGLVESVAMRHRKLEFD
jgi:rod shape determining protein RodA